MAYIYNLTDTWNAAGTTWYGIKLDVTNTSSAAASRLLALQVGGVNQFFVGKTGDGYFAGKLGIGTTPSFPLDVLSTTTDLGRFTSSDNTATAAPFNLYRNRTATAGDTVLRVNFQSNSSTGSLRNYGSILVDADVVTNAAENGSMRFAAIRAGTTTTMLDIDGGAALVSVIGNTGFSIQRTGVSAPAESDGNVFSGTYTPTLTNTTNVASSTASVCQYMRVGDVVTVSGQVAVTPTATGNTVLGISLPIASDITGTAQLGGTAMAQTTTQGAVLYGDGGNDRVLFRLQAAATTALTYSFSFTYKVA